MRGGAPREKFVNKGPVGVNNLEGSLKLRSAASISDRVLVIDASTRASFFYGRQVGEEEWLVGIEFFMRATLAQAVVTMRPPLVNPRRCESVCSTSFH